MPFININFKFSIFDLKCVMERPKKKEFSFINYVKFISLR